MRSVLACTVAVLLAACNHDDCVKRELPRIGSHDDSGHLVIHVFDVETRNPRAVHLLGDYGVMMYRNNDGRSTFVLGIKSPASVQEFAKYEDLTKALSRLPNGSAVDIYDRCSVPVFYDFQPVHEELFEKFKKDCGELGIALSDNPKITCTCTAEWR